MSKSLADLPANSRTIVRELRGGKEFMSRMVALGFTTGTEVKVVQNYGHGPLRACAAIPIMSLEGPSPGRLCMLVAVHGGPRTGLGAFAAHGPLIVLVRDTRVALGRGEALKVLVEETNRD